MGPFPRKLFDEALTFSWNTTGVAAGNYTITATGVPVSRETDLSNNAKTAKVSVLVPTTKPSAYDLNNDGIVDMKDIGIVGKAFGTSPGNPGWNPVADVSGPNGMPDGIVNSETHQVIVRVGYGKGPEMAERLEENNIIVNYQGAPDDEAFTTASCLRMGVQEMTRFGMKEEDFGELAEYMGRVILHNRSVAKEVAQFRKRFTEMKYCLPEGEAASMVDRLLEVIR